MAVNGTLIPIGGNEDKGRENDEQFSLEFIEEGILSRVVRESGGVESKIVVIPTASRIPKEVSKNYFDAFGKLGCKNVHFQDIRERSEAESEETIDLVSNAQCIMFLGRSV